jgi:hypothetical protein
MHVDFKITTWERVYVPKGKEEEFMDLIRNKEIESANDMFMQDENCWIERIDEADEQMTPDENNGCSTLEVYLDICEDPIFTNAEPQFKSQP